MLKSLKKKLIKKEIPDFEKNFKIFNKLLEIAKELVKIPPENSLEEIDIKVCEDNKWN